MNLKNQLNEDLRTLYFDNNAKKLIKQLNIRREFLREFSIKI